MITALAPQSTDSSSSLQPSTPSVPNATGAERSTFLSRAGHEMRNPLSNILALVEGIQDGIYGDIGLRQSEALGTIGENAQRLLSLVNGFLDAEKVHAGTITLQNTSFDLLELVEQAGKHILPAAQARTLEVSCASSPPEATGEGDSKRLLQIMIELLGCVVVSVPTKGRVHLSATADAPRRSLTISAWGGPSGIPPTALEEATPSPLAMERLRKLKGIGIALVECLLSLHGGGTLDACELPGNGLLVKVVVPLTLLAAGNASHEHAERKTTDAELTPPTPEVETSSHAPGSPLILLVDDEDVLRNITHDYLESVGYRVMAATNGKEALELANIESPDLVIMDMLMPIMDGMEALQKLRQSEKPALAHVPIIAMSGLAVPAERDRCMAAGADACLVKPFGIKQLEMAMNQFLASRHTNASA